MATYRITEQQLQKIYNEIEPVREDWRNPDMTDSNIPNPYEQEPRMSTAKDVKGPYIGCAYDRDEYLILNRQTNDIVYCHEDTFNDQASGEDLLDNLAEYMEVMMDNDPNGGKVYDWKDYVDKSAIPFALASFFNDMKNHGKNVAMTSDADDYLSGKYDFFVIHKGTQPEVLDDIVLSTKLKKIIQNPENIC